MMMISRIWSIFTVVLGESSILYLIQMYLYLWTSVRNLGLKWPFLTPMKKMVTLQVIFYGWFLSFEQELKFDAKLPNKIPQN